MGGVIRRARPEDGDHLAWVKDTADEGLGPTLKQIAIPDRDHAASEWRRDLIGKLADPTESATLANWWVAELDGAPAGGLLGYAFLSRRQPTDKTPGFVLPLLDLQGGAVGSYYIDSIATRPEARRTGLGRALLAQAEAEAREKGLDRLTLVALSSNHGARALYTDTGFHDAAEVRLAPAAWPPDADGAFLMEKKLTLT